MGSIQLHGVSWETPEGKVIFSELSLSFGPVRTGLVGRNGVGKSTLLKLVNCHLQPTSGTITVEGRVAEVAQGVLIDGELTIAGLFGLENELLLLEKGHAGDATADEIAEIDWTLETRIDAVLSRVGLSATSKTKIGELSGGQQTRARLAFALFVEPEFLLLDEPTNNLDREGREAVIELLRSWRRGAIVVSHDRELLEEVDEIVEISSLGVSRYGGNWAVYREMKELEVEAARKDVAEAEKKVGDLARRAQESRERQDRRNRTAEKKAAKGGIPRIIQGLKKDRAEKSTGEMERVSERLNEEARGELVSAKEKIENLLPIIVSMPSTRLPAGKVVLRMEQVTSGYEREKPVLRDFSMEIVGPQRVAIVGPNGSGKTTLLSLISGKLQTWSGTVNVMTSFAMLDQKVSLLDAEKTIRENFLKLHPTIDESACRSALARFQFRAEMAHQIVETLSGGQLLRAGLACVLGGTEPPPLLILDEPTNHLDVDSIESVEAGLRAYDGALLVVSHDEEFLKGVGVERKVELVEPPRHEDTKGKRDEG